MRKTRSEVVGAAVARPRGRSGQGHPPARYPPAPERRHRAVRDRRLEDAPRRGREAQARLASARDHETRGTRGRWSWYTSWYTRATSCGKSRG